MKTLSGILRTYPFFFLAFYFFPLRVQGTEQFIAAVEADVREFTTGSFDPPPQSPWLPAATEAGAEEGGADRFQEFANFLHKKYPGTYIQFNKLSEAQQRDIYKEYVRTGDLSRIRRSILSTLNTR